MHRWRVGAAPWSIIDNVCRRCFQNCYNIANSTVLLIVKQIKSGEVVIAPSIKDKTTIKNHVADTLIKMAIKRGNILSKSQIAMMHIPNSPACMTCYAWMHNYFELVGDCIPNSDGEVHLEPLNIWEVWEEYVEDMKFVCEPYLEVKTFGQMWKHCFPHVKIREFKAVTGILFVLFIVQDTIQLIHCLL